MNALFFLAAGHGPKPTVLLLHGLPGNERNLDLAQSIRRAGWNVLTFTYRGAWGSEGTFSLQHAVDDSAAALSFLRSPDAVRTYGIDLHRIVIAGHSMGGYMASHTAQHDIAETDLGRTAFPPLAGVILLDAWDIAGTARKVKAAGDKGRADFIAEMDDVGHALGPITAEDLADNLIRRGEEWSLLALAPALARQKTLTIYAAHGDAVDNRTLAAAMGACPGGVRAPTCRGRVTAVELNSDHSFSDSRIALAVEVLRWLAAI